MQQPRFMEFHFNVANVLILVYPFHACIYIFVFFFYIFLRTNATLINVRNVKIAYIFCK